MKTIEIKTGDQVAQFTTRSVTFDNKEFFYSKMEGLTHDADAHVYHFVYDGESRSLPYDPKYSKVLGAIFSQVANLGHNRTAAASAASDKAQDTSDETQSAEKQDVPETDAEQPAEHMNVRDIVEGESASEENAAASAEDTANAEDAAGADAETGSADSDAEKAGDADSDAPSDKKAAKLAEKERKKAEKEKRKAEKEKLKAEKAALKAADKPEDPYGASGDYDPKSDPERKLKVRKSLITFGIVIAVIAVIAVVFYFIFGTSDNPSSLNPNSNESQQYEDIDELIDDLQ